ncbi:hypothetical protein CsVMVgp5 [Cassava vein mosaic virus]|uniref:Uncharacterized 6 kDa protein n=1 Tax=Cassava vein mosaic virus TaxID=38062 RepID=YP06_CSVMV|nr:hypothetical protein CsVMVgp5 [Cassava vein mosaic virus]Q66285.1 RecName: Full=Uncharacterized 6 kDa protein [Cassava vein mosaic virus]AAB03329.1 ORF 5 [Cassava vein mosaic virus]
MKGIKCLSITCFLSDNSIIRVVLIRRMLKILLFSLLVLIILCFIDPILFYFICL